MARRGECSDCGSEVIHVRDVFTGATFAVDAEPIQARGFVLHRPRPGERNERAELQNVEVYRPHEQTCAAATDLVDDEDTDE